jgi:hypothetical protein
MLHVVTLHTVACSMIHLGTFSMAIKPLLPPGTKAPRSGQYENPKIGKEVTVTRGEPLPPTPGRNQGYRLSDPTNNKSGRGK